MILLVSMLRCAKRLGLSLRIRYISLLCLLSLVEFLSNTDTYWQIYLRL